MTFVVFAGQSNTGGAYMDASTLTKPWASDPLTLIWEPDRGAFVILQPGINTGFGALPNAWGPEVEFARDFRQAHPNEPLWIVKYAEGGTGLALNAGAWVYDWSPQSADELFDRASFMIGEASTALGRRPDAVFFGQGEEDGTRPGPAAAYDDNLAPFFHAVRETWMEDADGKIGFFRINTTTPYADDVRAGQLAVDLADDAAASFDTRGFALQPDNLHYAASGYDRIGDGYFQVYESWGSDEPPPPPPPQQGRVIEATRSGDTLAGGAGADTLVASQGADRLTGGEGADSFTFKALPWSAGRITDFAVGVDRLDLSAIFRASGYTGADPIGDGRMRLESDGAGGTRLFFDRDAPNSGDWPFHVTTLAGVASGGLTWAKLSGGGATNPPPPAVATIGFNAAATQVAEGSAGFHTIAVATVTRSSSEGSATVEWRLDPSGANPVDSVDFSGGGSRPGTGIVTFAAGETSKPIALTLNGDTTVESNETFTLTLLNPQNGKLGTSTSVVTLQNDDTAAPPPTGSGQVLTSDQYGDTLIGGTGNDTLNAGQGPDKLTGGGGADRFVFGKLPWVRGEISDFRPGQDVLDLSALAPAYAGSTPIADGRLELRAAGGGTEVYVDIDGPGGEWPFAITLLRGVTPSQLGAGDWLF